MNISTQNNCLSYLSYGFRSLLEGKNRDEWVTIVSNNGNNLKRLANFFTQIVNKTPWENQPELKNLANSVLKSLNHHKSSLDSKVPAHKIQRYELAKRIFNGSQSDPLKAHHLETNLRLNILRVFEVMKQRASSVSNEDLALLGTEFVDLLRGKNQTEWINIVTNHGNNLDRGIRFFQAIIKNTNWKENPALWLQAATIYEALTVKKTIYTALASEHPILIDLAIEFRKNFPEKFSSNPPSNIPKEKAHEPLELSEEEQMRRAMEESLKSNQDKAPLSNQEKGKEKVRDNEDNAYKDLSEEEQMQKAMEESLKNNQQKTTEQNIEQSPEFMEFVKNQMSNFGEMSIANVLTQYKDFLVSAFLPNQNQEVKDPADNDLTLGAGIQNGGNSCYLNSVIQSLRIIPGLYEAIKPVDESLNANQKELRKKLVSLINTLEGLDGVEKRTVTKKEINEFRDHLFAMGFAEYAKDDRQRQIDAPECIQFILDGLNLPRSRFVITSLSETAIIADEVIDDHYLPIGIESVGHESTIQKQLTENIVDVQLREEDRQATRVMKCVSLDSTHVPQFIVVNLGRFVYGGTKADFVQQKLKTKIIPSETIELPLHKSNETAQYTLQSLVVHQGDSTGGGHYYAYRMINGLKRMMRFDDNAVKKTVQPDVDKIGEAENDPTILNDIYQNGYLFVYTRET